MFGLGFAEIAVVVIVALLVFGPDKLPSLARQAGQFVRTVRSMADNAKSDLSRELGSDLNELDLRSLDPREVVRRAITGDDDRLTSKPLDLNEPARPALRSGQPPPFDSEAT